jgi:hypothetical protein
MTGKKPIERVAEGVSWSERGDRGDVSVYNGASFQIYCIEGEISLL